MNSFEQNSALTHLHVFQFVPRIFPMDLFADFAPPPPPSQKKKQGQNEPMQAVTYLQCRFEVCKISEKLHVRCSSDIPELHICVWQYVHINFVHICACICLFAMHSNKFLFMKHCWSNKGHSGNEKERIV